MEKSEIIVHSIPRRGPGRYVENLKQGITPKPDTGIDFVYSDSEGSDRLAAERYDNKDKIARLMERAGLI